MKVLVMTAMYPTPDNPAFGSFVKTQVDALRAEGLEVDLLVLSGSNRKLMYLTGLFEMRKRLRRGDIDLVHAHFSYVGVLARLQKRVPVVVTYHGDDLLGSVVDESGRHSKFSLAMVRMGQFLGRRIDAAIVQSDEMSGKLDHAEHVHIVPHEVDFETFRVVDRDEARRQLGLDRRKPYLLFAANPDVPVKRFPFARQIVDSLQKDIPDVELLVVHREPQTRLALYMNACDALLFPSFQEGSPNIVKQALACNLPVVATDVGDVSEVTGGWDECHICRADVDDFVVCLTELLTSCSSQDRTQTKGRLLVQRFDRPLVVRRLTDVYRGAINKFQARAFPAKTSLTS